jgi:hypothetical protein
MAACVTANHILKWNGTAWACAADADAGGDITGVTAGAGLTGGGTTGAPTLSVSGVTSAMITNGTIVSADILDGTITAADILDGTIGAADIATSAVTGAEILDGTIGSLDLAAGAVTTAKIAACVTVNHILKWNGTAWACAADVDSGGDITGVTAGAGLTGGGTTGAPSLAVSGVTSAMITNGTITGTDILDGTIGALDIATSAVTGAEILDGTITAADILDGTITAGDIATSAVTGTEILDGTIGANDLGAGAVTVAKIGSCAPYQYLHFNASAWECRNDSTKKIASAITTEMNIQGTASREFYFMSGAANLVLDVAGTQNFSGYGVTGRATIWSGSPIELSPVQSVSLSRFAGNVGIGVASPTYKLQVNGQPAANGYTAFTNYSDRRLKRNISVLPEGSLDKILRLKPSTFYYNDKSGYDEETKNRMVTGFIAQELKEVFPGMVGKVVIDGTEYLDTDLSALQIHLVRAVQEQQALIEELRGELSKLKDEVQGKVGP